MPEREFVPHSRYQTKMLLVTTMIALLTLLGAGILAALISLDDPRVGLDLFVVAGILDALSWLVAIMLAFPYFRSLRYEVLEDEVIVHVGIFTHSVKHVPYRTVTNITVKRDIFDRWFFNLGSLHVQTAGMSGQSGAEEKLVGLENVQQVYEIVVASLRRFRGAMTPTAAQEELPTDGTAAILVELQAIRQLMEQNKD